MALFRSQKNRNRHLTIPSLSHIVGRVVYNHFMKFKFISVGFLVGFSAGVVTLLLFPQITEYALSFVRLSNSSMGFPADYFSIKSGSLFGNSISVVWMIFGLTGAVIGFVAFKLKQIVKK